MSGLEGMTWERWQSMPLRDLDELRDLSDLSPQLRGLEGYRVEVVDQWGEVRRFWVGRSTGWKPIHLEIARINSNGGGGADRAYRSVVVVRRNGRQ